MAKTRSMTRKEDHDGVAPWSDVNHDVLYLVMMQLGVVDFLAFSEVCKSWRSLALSHRNSFMASRLPMKIHKKDSYYYLEDYEGRRIRTIIPHSDGRICCGVTCGYLILFGKETCDFWLVNPITRHELHFPDFPLRVSVDEENIRAVLVFSASISRWMFVMLDRKIWPDIVSFYIVGKHGWNHVHSTLPTPSIIDLHAFNGKIYTLHMDCSSRELRLDPNRKRKWTLLENKYFSKPNFYIRSRPELVSSGENLYIINRLYSFATHVLELDFDKMQWVSPKKTIREYAFFFSALKSSAAIKPESLALLRK